MEISCFREKAKHVQGKRRAGEITGFEPELPERERTHPPHGLPSCEAGRPLGSGIRAGWTSGAGLDSGTGRVGASSSL